jgi:uncharacterized delta-60 repeat protein
MKAKLTFVSFFAVVTLLAIPAHSQGLLKRIKPWLYPDDSLDASGTKRMQTPESTFDGKNFGNKWASPLSNFSSQLTETQSFSDSVQALWVRHYASGLAPADDRAIAVAVDTAGNVYVTGYTEGSDTYSDYATIKYNTAGVQQWVARYNGPGNGYDRATALAVDAAGNVYVTGYSYSGVYSDYATIKYNAAGIQQWMARYNGPGNGNDQATALEMDAAGNVYVTGSSYSGSSDDYATIKYNTAGVQQWVVRYNGPGNSSDVATTLGVDVTGNVYVTGYSAGSYTSDDYATIKYNASGAQQWVARYDGPVNYDDRATALGVDVTGNVYVTGYSTEFGNTDYATVKYNASGAQQWVARYNGPGNSSDGATALVVDAAGNVYVTGSSFSGTSHDYATIKYNTAGNRQWLARYNELGNSIDTATALAVDATGNIYVTGSSYSDKSAGYATIKYNATGVQQWGVRYHGPENGSDYLATDLAVDAMGNVYVTGYSYPDSFSVYATIKYNAAGIQQWVVRYNGPGNSYDRAAALTVDAAGNVYVTGSSYSGASGDGDYATIKYNAVGDQQWVARYNGPRNGNDQATALGVDTAGNVYVTGYSPGSSSPDDADYTTIKYNAAGVQQWVARYGPENYADRATALWVDAVGNIYVTGYSFASSTSYDYATIKYNEAGIQQWVARYNGSRNGYDLATAIGVDAEGNVYVTGSSSSDTFTDRDYATIKYNAAGVQQWVACYNGPGNGGDRATALAVDAAGNVYVTGYSYSGVYSDYATIKYNVAGVEQWVARYDGPGDDDQATALAVDAAGNVYVTGHSSIRSSTFYRNYTTIKYPQTVTSLNATTLATTNVSYLTVMLNGRVNPNRLSLKVYFEYGITGSYGDTVAASPGMVTGADDISVSADLSNLSPNTVYHYRVFALYGDGLIEGKDQTFTTLPCASVLTINHATPSQQPVGTSITLTADILSPCGVASAVLKYRQGGEAQFKVAARSNGNSLYQWSIPDSAVTARGLEYFIAVTLFAETFTTQMPAVGVFSIPVEIAQGLRKEEAQPSGNEQNAYRLISMPLDLDDRSAKAVVEDNLGLYNKKKWRLFALNANQQEYVEFPDFADTVKMDPGRAFLLIVNDPGKFIDTGAGKSNRTDKSFSLVLYPRWNFVGNPFNFPIPLEKLSVKSGKSFPLRYHEGTWRDPFLNKVSEINPFEGYAVFNTLDVADTLFINPDLSPSTSSIAKDFASGIEEKMQWSIRILAQCQDALDEDNRAAIVSGASSSWDERDQPEPPVIGEYVSVYFPHPEWSKLAKNYCTDFRPLTSDIGLRTSDGEIWEFEVKTNIRDKVNLTFEGIDEVPKELEVWLMDDALQIIQNLRGQRQYAVAGAEHPKQLKLVVGKRGFVDEKLAEARAIPTTYELSQNFPNPFNPATTIRYGLPKAERVTLKIYNLLGAEVATLVDNEQKVAGYHAAVWDGRDKAGRVVASGVYVYRLQAGSFSSTKKLALVK